MSEEGPAKRVNPKMNRGSFRLQFTIWSVWTALQLLAITNNILGVDGWAFGEYLNVIMLILGLAAPGYLLHVRRRDEHFRRANEEQRADWERRGRAL
ncbi:hypothetical protein [Arthrobacter sedimenti]|uniref:hypothetical protein n=1 Tax=Arthrobacter sedimenti TaxID=2694931 RepID=UPI00111D1A26|nr:hypothetical protein [Arthrobacter sedimenti]